MYSRSIVENVTTKPEKGRIVLIEPLKRCERQNEHEMLRCGLESMPFSPCTSPMFSAILVSHVAEKHGGSNDSEAHRGLEAFFGLSIRRTKSMGSFHAPLDRSTHALAAKWFMDARQKVSPTNTEGIPEGMRYEWLVSTGFQRAPVVVPEGSAFWDTNFYFEADVCLVAVRASNGEKKACGAIARDLTHQENHLISAHKLVHDRTYYAPLHLDLIPIFLTELVLTEIALQKKQHPKADLHRRLALHRQVDRS